MKLIWKVFEFFWPGDWMMGLAMSYLNRERLQELREGGPPAQAMRKRELIEKLKASPRAILTQAANEQHYELPPGFFELVLGPHLKYSSGYWPSGVDSLVEAEEAMLNLYLQRAQLANGQRILELGCGWGSLTLWMARHFPSSRILGISNSHSQREFILARAAQLGLTNVEILTCDVCQLELGKQLPAESFDRVVSVEMLEHVRNYRDVFALLRGALKPGGKLFVHVFAHSEHPFLFDPRHRGGISEDWMERYFFAGGVMPSADLFRYFSEGLDSEEFWPVNGVHYQRTALAWLANMRRQREQVCAIFREHYGAEWRRWWLYWQIFFLACANLFGYDRGHQWMVCHYRWSKSESN